MDEKRGTPRAEDPLEPDRFAKLAEENQPGFIREFWDFLRQNKKWWLTPIMIVLFLLIFLVIISQTPLAPFLYPFF